MDERLRYGKAEQALRPPGWPPNRAVGGVDRLVRVIRVCSILIGLAYVPMSLTYMFYAFHTGAPRLEESFVTALNGHAYSEGNAVVQERFAVYAERRWTMLIHTTFSAAALFLGLTQVVIRKRLSGQHHARLGRWFLTCTTVGMVAGFVFVAQSPPISFEGGAAFRLQLVELGLATLVSAWLGALFVRLQMPIAHRACIGLALSFLMTAPLLRLGWTVLGPLMPSQDLLANLGASSVALAVVAPAVGTLGLACSPQVAKAIPTGTTLAACALASMTGVGILTSAGVILEWNRRFGSELLSFPAFHVVPAIGYLIVCVGGAVAARSRGESDREREWIVLSGGASLTSFATLVCTWTGDLILTRADAMMTALMVAPGGPVIVSLVVVVSMRTGTASPERASTSRDRTQVSRSTSP